MSADKPSYLLSILSNKCPRCRQGHIFQSKNAYELKANAYMKMHERCPVCGQVTDIEVGFYYGTGYVSYGITMLLSGVSFVLWWILIGLSINDNRVFWWLGINTVVLIILQPPLMRFCRTLWLSWFVKYDPDWEKKKPEDPERIIKEQMGNW